MIIYKWQIRANVEFPLVVQVAVVVEVVQVGQHNQTLHKIYNTLLYYVFMKLWFPIKKTHINVMVSVLASNLVDRGFEPRSGEPKTQILEFVIIRWRRCIKE